MWGVDFGWYPGLEPVSRQVGDAAMNSNAEQSTREARNRGLVSWRAFVVLACLAVQPVARGQIYGTLAVTGGTVSGIGGDQAWSGAPLIPCRFSGLVYNDKIQCLLDLGSARSLDAIILVNATNTATNLNAKNADILVAADENALGFTYSDPASYTVPVFSGTFLPNVNTASAIRKAGLTGRHKRRYFLINHTANRFGPAETIANTFEIRFHNLYYDLAPPSGTVLLAR